MPSAPRPPMENKAETDVDQGVDLDALRRRIAALERASGAGSDTTAGRAVVTLGVAEIDAHLPWGGLPQGGLHEVAFSPAPGGDAAAAGFAAAMLARLAGNESRAVVWCRRPARGFRPGLYGAGLARFGLDPAHLLLAQARDSQAVLWSMEECLRSRAVAAVLGEPDRADLTARRRLQLAAEDNGVAALLLLDAGTAESPGPALTRWRVTGAPAPPGRSAWRVELLKCRDGGRPGAWTLEWRHEDGFDTENGDAAGRFRLAAPLRHGPDGKSARRRAG